MSIEEEVNPNTGSKFLKIKGNIKGIFTRKKKDRTLPPSRDELEESYEIDTEGLGPVQPKDPPDYPVQQLPPTPVTQKRTNPLKEKMQRMIEFQKPPPAHPTVNLYGEPICELRPLKPQPLCRISMVLNLIFVGGIVAGIVLSAMSGSNRRAAVLGPVLLGLALFGFVGKAFFSIFWNEDPLPQVRRVAEKIDAKVEQRIDKVVQRRGAHDRAMHLPPEEHAQWRPEATPMTSEPELVRGDYPAARLDMSIQMTSEPYAMRTSYVPEPAAMPTAAQRDSAVASRLAVGSVLVEPEIEDLDRPRGVSTPTPLDTSLTDTPGVDRVGDARGEGRKKCAIM